MQYWQAKWDLDEFPQEWNHLCPFPEQIQNLKPSLIPQIPFLLHKNITLERLEVIIIIKCKNLEFTWKNVPIVRLKEEQKLFSLEEMDTYKIGRV